MGVLHALSFDQAFLSDLIFAALATLVIYLVLRSGGLARLGKKASISITAAVLAAMLLPIAFRAALLPWKGAPQPHIHDEFGHLLVAETLASGRLANPPHPLARHLDTIYVLQKPAYASVYPIGQGLILAVGDVIGGNPWIGVLLATALMGGAITWALFDWLPPNSAAIGGLLAAFGYGLRWADTYWGGAFCAFGGALMFGALSRLQKSPSVTLGFVAGLGWAIAWLVRPYESVLLFVCLWVGIAWFVTKGQAPRTKWLATLAVLVCMQAGAGMLTLATDRAITGSFTTMPQQLSQRVDGVPQSFLWQRVIPAPSFRFREMQDMYLWQLKEKKLSPLSRASSVLHTIWDFFITPWYSIPALLGIILLWADPKVKVATAIAVATAAAGVSYPFFFPHYIAAYSCILMFLVMCGFRAMWERPAVRWLAVFLMLGGLFAWPVRTMPLEAMMRQAPVKNGISRADIAAKLKAMGGSHVVFVRYGPNHTFQDEWVYNSANVDASPIVWCRWMGSEEDGEVMNYYKGRLVWIVDVEGGKLPPALSRYDSELRQGPLMTAGRQEKNIKGNDENAAK
jgi:hypothetical protein